MQVQWIAKSTIKKMKYFEQIKKHTLFTFEGRKFYKLCVTKVYGYIHLSSSICNN